MPYQQLKYNNKIWYWRKIINQYESKIEVKLHLDGTSAFVRTYPNAKYNRFYITKRLESMIHFLSTGF